MNTTLNSANDYIISEDEKNRATAEFRRLICLERNPDAVCAAFSHEGQPVYFYFTRYVLEALLENEDTAYLAVEVGVHRSEGSADRKAGIILYGLDQRGNRNTEFFNRSRKCPPTCLR